jgi:hypothetical protein
MCVFGRCCVCCMSQPDTARFSIFALSSRTPRRKVRCFSLSRMRRLGCRSLVGSSGTRWAVLRRISSSPTRSSRSALRLWTSFLNLNLDARARDGKPLEPRTRNGSPRGSRHGARPRGSGRGPTPTRTRARDTKPTHGNSGSRVSFLNYFVFSILVWRCPRAFKKSNLQSQFTNFLRSTPCSTRHLARHVQTSRVLPSLLLWRPAAMQARRARLW